MTDESVAVPLLATTVALDTGDPFESTTVTTTSCVPGFVTSGGVPHDLEYLQRLDSARWCSSHGKAATPTTSAITRRIGSPSMAVRRATANLTWTGLASDSYLNPRTNVRVWTGQPPAWSLADVMQHGASRRGSVTTAPATGAAALRSIRCRPAPRRPRRRQTRVWEDVHAWRPRRGTDYCCTGRPSRRRPDGGVHAAETADVSAMVVLPAFVRTHSTRASGVRCSASTRNRARYACVTRASECATLDGMRSWVADADAAASTVRAAANYLALAASWDIFDATGIEMLTLCSDPDCARYVGTASRPAGASSPLSRMRCTSRIDERQAGCRGCWSTRRTCSLTASPGVRSGDCHSGPPARGRCVRATQRPMRCQRRPSPRLTCSSPPLRAWRTSTPYRRPSQRISTAISRLDYQKQPVTRSSSTMAPNPSIT